MPHALKIYTRPDHGKEPLFLHTPDEVRAWFAAWRDASPAGSVDLATFYLAGDDWGPELNAGLDGDKGVLHHSGDDGTSYGFHSRDPGGSNPDEVVYYFFTADTPFPPHSEIPVAAVESAVLEFMSTGLRPTCVHWQAWIPGTGHVPV
ncbi:MULTISPECIES: Imm1 family immunity protein [Actinosynnema]|uniref:Imm1 family immunity protein n=1 Tax=Actinosynnema TaxID=40566 RepID=UPI0027E30A3D|nr:Imm1 family immunity protein [Actinosynnema pretiosum]MCP2093918.1 Immunity protein Imm1 [Actinosynnema pretiosum]